MYVRTDVQYYKSDSCLFEDPLWLLDRKELNNRDVVTVLLFKKPLHSFSRQF